MSDVDINTIPADNNGYNYYMFTDDKTEEELVLYVRTKEEFQDTAKVYLGGKDQVLPHFMIFAI